MNSNNESLGTWWKKEQNRKKKTINKIVYRWHYGKELFNNWRKITSNKSGNNFKDSQENTVFAKRHYSIWNQTSMASNLRETDYAWKQYYKGITPCTALWLIILIYILVSEINDKISLKGRSNWKPHLLDEYEWIPS